MYPPSEPKVVTACENYLTIKQERNRVEERVLIYFFKRIVV